MIRHKILLVCENAVDCGWVEREVSWGEIVRYRAEDDADDLLELLREENPAVILHATDCATDLKGVCRVLSMASLGPRTVPVVVLAARYDESAARVCFQMGVTDYLGRLEHRHRLGEVLRLLAGRELPAAASRMALPTPAERFAALVE